MSGLHLHSEWKIKKGNKGYVDIISLLVLSYGDKHCPVKGGYSKANDTPSPVTIVNDVDFEKAGTESIHSVT